MSKIVMRNISGEGYKTISSVLNFSNSTVVSIIGKLKKYGTTQTLPSWSSDQTKQPGKKDLGQGGDQEPNDHSDRTRECIG